MSNPIISDIYSFRDTNKLYALPATVACMLQGCVSCSYKLLVEAPKSLDDIVLTPKCHPNVRPELCVRVRNATSNTNKMLPPTLGTHDHILVVGDGDFTFSHSLAKLIENKSNLTATSFMSLDDVLQTYDDAAETLKDMQGVRIMHNVDATKLQESFGVDEIFDRIIFNFPCIPDEEGHDGQTDELAKNQRLIIDFLSSASKLIDPRRGEIHIVHKTRPPFSWWKIDTLCESVENCEFVRRVVFDRSVFPEYVPRKAADKKSFPVFDAETYCFKLASTDDHILKEADTESLFSNDMQLDTLIKVTERRLRQVVAMLQLIQDGKGPRQGNTVKRPRQDIARKYVNNKNNGKRQKKSKGGKRSK